MTIKYLVMWEEWPLIVGFETWYGYALLESAESYSIGEITHLD